MRTPTLLLVLSCVAHARRVQGSGAQVLGSKETSSPGLHKTVPNPWKALAWILLSPGLGFGWQMPGQASNAVARNNIKCGVRLSRGLDMHHPHPARAHVLMNADGASGAVLSVFGARFSAGVWDAVLSADADSTSPGSYGNDGKHVGTSGDDNDLTNAEGASGKVVSTDAPPNSLGFYDSSDKQIAGNASLDLPSSVKPGVVTGRALGDLLDYAKEEGFVIPGFKFAGTRMESVQIDGGPIMFTFSMGGSQSITGKVGPYLKSEDYPAWIASTIAGAKHMHEVAKLYGFPVILRTDHCSKKALPWIDGLMAANEEHFARNGYPLFSSHMLDLSEEPFEENVATCKKYLERMAQVDVLLEMEPGINVGIDEDGVGNTDVGSSKLYTQSDEVRYANEQMSQVPNGRFTIGAAFGDVTEAAFIKMSERRPFGVSFFRDPFSGRLLFGPYAPG